MPSLDNSTALLFEELKTGLSKPLSGLGVAFSSSLFGLALSLILGFLDLQAGQAQNLFFRQVENWLSTVTKDESKDDVIHDDSTARHKALTSLTDALARIQSKDHAVGVIELAENVRTLIQQMRLEQQTIRNWAEHQANQQQEMKVILEKLTRKITERE